MIFSSSKRSVTSRSVGLPLFSNATNALRMNLFTLIFATAVSCAVASKLPKNCEEIQQLGYRNLGMAQSGSYKIYPSHTKESGFEVLCDMDTSGGGWTVIQQRSEFEPQIDFYRSWEEYVDGFGMIGINYWLGLDIISSLTNAANYVLRVDMMNWDGEERFAEYNFFQIANSTELYKLTVHGFSGNAFDSLEYHNGMNFTTKDRDNDKSISNCAILRHGAWWYNSCNESNLNGVHGPNITSASINWIRWQGGGYSLKRVQMKIRTQCYNSIMGKF